MQNLEFKEAHFTAVGEAEGCGYTLVVQFLYLHLVPEQLIYLTPIPLHLKERVMLFSANG